MWVDLQLPLYELLLRRQRLEGQMALGFVNLAQDLRAPILALASWSEEDLGSARRSAESVVRRVRASRFWPPGEPPAYDDGLHRLVASP